jgi:hypothetical protein
MMRDALRSKTLVLFSQGGITGKARGCKEEDRKRKASGGRINQLVANFGRILLRAGN